jgi:hypothetical protein
MSGARRALAMSPASLWKIGREGLVNVAAPFLLYTLAQPRFGDVWALIAASAPAILWSGIEFARHRRIDALSALVLAGIALSLLALAGGGSARLLQLREKLVTAVIGLVFLGSIAIGKPLMYGIVRAFLARNNPSDVARVESLRSDASFRRAMKIMTLVWGVGLLADAAASAALVFVLPIQTYLVVNSVLGYAAIGSLTAWNIWFGRRTRRRREARMAAAPDK